MVWSGLSHHRNVLRWSHNMKKWAVLSALKHWGAFPLFCLSVKHHYDLKTTWNIDTPPSGFIGHVQTCHQSQRWQEDVLFVFFCVVYCWADLDWESYWRCIYNWLLGRLRGGGGRVVHVSVSGAHIVLGGWYGSSTPHTSQCFNVFSATTVCSNMYLI